MALTMQQFFKRSLLNSVRFYASSSAELSADLRSRLQKYVNSSPVVVFMKGTQQEPMCGFSKNVKMVLFIIRFLFTMFIRLNYSFVRFLVIYLAFHYVPDAFTNISPFA
ncbi:unnamed protein product [Anisakis simplex]|uniref:Glutaredoxin domain-containing protein n=1 Tax=Anisakis simplex TaxID=6269 RepID=A0A0M3JA56_ANISI|nr:unnamed protein product [Anisakis simplex]